MHAATDSTPGAWILQRLHPFGVDVGSVIPDGFASYVRILHPACTTLPDGSTRHVGWHEIAAANGRTVPEELQQVGIDGAPLRYSDDDAERWPWDMLVGDLPREIAERLVAILRSHTATPERCWFAAWVGRGEPTRFPGRMPVLEVPQRDMYLLQGTIDDALATLDEVDWIHRSANLWWPDDRSWCVATEIDFSWTYVGGSAACVAAILADASLECLPSSPTESNTMRDPLFEELARFVPGRVLRPVTVGESRAKVWRCTAAGEPALYLKAAPLRLGRGLEDEAARLRWMRARGVPVPAVRRSGRAADTEFLVLEELPGLPASDPRWADNPIALSVALGTALARLHRTPIDACPFDHRVEHEVALARRRVADGAVHEDDFDEERADRTAVELLAELEASVPSTADPVFTHGDCCLPNVIMREAHGTVDVAGFVDCGRAGIGDRYRDLALAARSIVANVGTDGVSAFLDAYGLAEPDVARLRFYTLLDEFF